MSNIEKALEKKRKEKKEDEGKTSTPEHTDTVKSYVHDKGGADHSPPQKMTELDNNASMLDYLEAYGPESSS